MEFFRGLLANYGISESANAYLPGIMMIVVIILLCVTANFVTKKIILRLITQIINKKKFKWGKIFLEHKLFHKASHIVPAIIIHYFAPAFPSYEIWIEKAAQFYMIAVIIAVLNTLLNTANEIYMNFEVSKVRPIKGFIQVLKIIVFIVGGITLISILIDKNPLLLLSGLGALSAILMLIFKDSILGFVAGVQLSTNDMIRVGDWVEMPKHNADGAVVDITLNTVKVQNWDMTITMVPSYAFVSDSFKNWRGMQDAGGRRIKRSVYIDTTSIRFCTQEMLERFRKIRYLTEYIDKKEKEIEAYNIANKITVEGKANGRNLTNIGTFRIYIQKYLQNHESIHKGMAIMVRQLSPVDNGLPLEIYCFTNTTRWADYEAVQSDIFDHILAVAPEFELRIFQKPGGYDMRSFVEN